MKKRNYLYYLLCWSFFLISGHLCAQELEVSRVGMGTHVPDSSAELDVKSDNTGVLIPRVSNISTAIPNPANGLLAYDLDRQCLSQNIGTPTAPDWVCISGNVVRFFYMPSIVLDVVGVGPKSYDLYELYKKQFSRPMAASPGAPAEIPFFKKATDLYYYVTDYSRAVFADVRISENGILTYDLWGKLETVDPRTDIMNVVLVVK